MSGKRQKKIITSVAAFTMLVTMMAPSAYAIPAKPFSDTGTDHWGFRDIIKMNARSVVSGYTDGTFQPNKPVSQVEAVIMAVHNMEVEDALSQIDINQELPFTVPLWAEEGNKRELLYAVEKGLIVPSENNFNASANASRAWVTQLIVRMADKESEALQYSDQTVPVDDGSSIPAWAAPYINVALKYNMASGYPDDTFRPNQNVTRAEMVSLLSRSEQFLNLGAFFLKGQIVNITAQNLTLSVNGAIKNVNLSTSTWAFDENGKSVDAASLALDTPVSVLAEGVTVKYIEVLSANAIVNSVKGTVLQVLPAEKIISIKDGAQKLQTFNLSASTLISAQNGSATSLAQIKQGDQVEFNLNASGNIISVVLLNGTVNDANTGIIYNINLDQNLIIIKTPAGKYNTYQFDDQTLVKISESRFPGMADLQIGDEVRTTVTGDMLTEIELVKPNQELTLKGKVVLKSADPKILTLEKEDGTLQAFAINDQAAIVISGQSSPVFSDVAVGDALELKINQGIVTEITVQNRNYKDTVKGTVVGIDNSNKVLTLKLEDDTLKAYDVERTAEIELNGNTGKSLSDVKKDMKVQIRLTNNKVVYVTTKDTVEGSIVSVDQSKDLITITKAGTSQQQTYDLAPNAKVYIKTMSGEDLDDVKREDYVELVVEKNLITKINVKTVNTYEILSVDEKDDELKVRDKNGNTTYLELDDDVDLIIPDIDSPVTGDFEKNNLVNATFLGDKLVKVEATAIARGKVTSLNTYSGLITVEGFDGTTSTFTFISGSQVKKDGNTTSILSTVKNSDRVEIIQNADKTLTISPMKKLNVKYQSVSSNEDTIYIQTTDGIYYDYDFANDPYLHKGTSTLELYQISRNDLIDIYILDNTVYEVEKK